MINKVKEEIRYVERKKERLQREIEIKLSEIQQIAETKSLNDVTTFMESKIKRLQDIKVELVAIEEQMNMLRFLLME